MDLLTESELHMLSTLRLSRRVRVRGRAASEFRSSDKGMGLEFTDYRPYTPGDDIRGVDWHQYQKHKRLVVRQYERYESPVFDIIVDVSDSIVCGDLHRLQSVRKLSAAYSFLLLRHGCKVVIRPTGGKAAARPFFGASRWASCAAHIASLPAGGGGDILEMLSASAGGSSFADGAVIVSDMLCASGLEQLKRTVFRTRGQLTLVHVYINADMEPELSGDMTLVDAESQALQTMTINKQTINAYKTAYKQYYETLGNTAIGAGHQYTDVCGQHDFLDQIRVLAPTGVVTV